VFLGYREKRKTMIWMILTLLFSSVDKDSSHTAVLRTNFPLACNTHTHIHSITPHHKGKETFLLERIVLSAHYCCICYFNHNIFWTQKDMERIVFIWLLPDFSLKQFPRLKLWANVPPLIERSFKLIKTFTEMLAHKLYF